MLIQAGRKSHVIVVVTSSTEQGQGPNRHDKQLCSLDRLCNVQWIINILISVPPSELATFLESEFLESAAYKKPRQDRSNPRKMLKDLVHNARILGSSSAFEPAWLVRIPHNS